jgi:hypothetical protein
MSTINLTKSTNTTTSTHATEPILHQKSFEFQHERSHSTRKEIRNLSDQLQGLREDMYRKDKKTFGNYG